MPLLSKYTKLVVQLIGGEWGSFPNKGKKVYDQLKVTYPDRIIHLGFDKNVFQTMADSDLVIGAGRVAIEVLVIGTPLLAIGEA